MLVSLVFCSRCTFLNDREDVHMVSHILLPALSLEPTFCTILVPGSREALVFQYCDVSVYKYIDYSAPPRPQNNDKNSRLWGEVP